MESTGIQSRGEHDFDVYYPDGRNAIVEVGMIADEGMRGLIAAVTSSRHGGELVPVKHARDGWYVTPRPDARVNQIRREADSVLAALDAAGIQGFDLEFFADYMPVELALKIKEVGLLKGDVVRFVPPGKFWIGLPSIGGGVDPSAVARAVIEVSSRPDNLRKLDQAKAGERHLFVYVDGTANDVQGALLLCEPISVPEALPPQVTHIWVATYRGTLDEAVVWRGERRGMFTRYELKLPPSGQEGRADEPSA
jgi:hypothetical protein